MIVDLEQNTQEWLDYRGGIPTASQFHRLVTPAKVEPSKQITDYAIQLAAEKWAGGPVDSWEGNEWTERGHELEPEARMYYAMLRGEVEEVGFIVSDRFEAGCSPDGLIDEGLLEIKNLGAKAHVKALAQTECPRDNMAQLQGQMLICERPWVDLLLYHPQLPKRLIRVTPIEKFQTLLIEQIAKVCQERDRYYKIIEAAA